MTDRPSRRAEIDARLPGVHRILTEMRDSGDPDRIADGAFLLGMFDAIGDVGAEMVARAERAHLALRDLLDFAEREVAGFPLEREEWYARRDFARNVLKELAAVEGVSEPETRVPRGAGAEVRLGDDPRESARVGNSGSLTPPMDDRFKAEAGLTRQLVERLRGESLDVTANLEGGGHIASDMRAAADALEVMHGMVWGLAWDLARYVDDDHRPYEAAGLVKEARRNYKLGLELADSLNPPRLEQP